MTFKVNDLMVNVGAQREAEEFTCTTVTWTGNCVDSLLAHGQGAEHELSLLKAQLRRAAARA